MGMGVGWVGVSDLGFFVNLSGVSGAVTHVINSIAVHIHPYLNPQ